MSKGFLGFKKNLGRAAITMALVGATTIGASAMAKEAVVTENLNLRTGASVNHSIVTVMNKGEKIEILEQNDSWCKVKYNNKEGYASAKYIKVVNNKGTKLNGITTAEDGLNVRQESNAKATILSNLPKGTKVSITGNVGDWYEISLNGKVGYVHKNYIKTEGSTRTVQAASLSGCRKVTVTADRLNVRRGPSTKYPVMAKVLKGKTYDVISESNGWYKVNHYGSEGYISVNYTQQVKEQTNNSATGKTFVVRVGSAKLNVRKDGHPKAPVIAKLNDGQEVINLTDYNTPYGWEKIKVGNIIGYVESNYIAEEKTENSLPKITCPQSLTLTTRDDFNNQKILNMIKAVDEKDGDITSKVSIQHAIDIRQPGKYVINLSVTNSRGNTSTEKIFVTVERINCVQNQAPIISVNRDITLKVGQVYNNSMLQLKINDDMDGNLTSKAYISGYVNTSKAGTYELTISATDSSGLESVETVRVKVIENNKNSAPVIYAKDSVKVKKGSKFDISLFNVSAQDNEDGNLTNKIKVSGSADTNKVGTHTLTLSVTDSYGIETRKSVNLIVEDTVNKEGWSDPNAEEFRNIVQNEMFRLINQHRRNNGLHELNRLPRLDGMARSWSKFMGTKGFFAHTYNGQSASNIFSQFGESSGENIAMSLLLNDGDYTRSDAENLANNLFNRWKKSSGHNANMLDKWFYNFGFDFYAKTDSYGNLNVYATQEYFGNPVKTITTNQMPELKEDKIEDIVKPEQKVEKSEEINKDAEVAPKEEVIENIEKDLPKEEVTENIENKEVKDTKDTNSNNELEMNKAEVSLENNASAWME